MLALERNLGYDKHILSGLRWGVLIGCTAAFRIFVMKGMHNKFGVENFGELRIRLGHTGDLSAWGKVVDPG